MFTTRQRIKILSFSGLLLLLSLLLPILFHADILTASTITSNGHFPREVKSAPLHLETDAFGRISGYTAGGDLVRQSKITEAEDAYLHRIDIDNTFFYVSDRGVITADSDTIALSIYHGSA